MRHREFVLGLSLLTFGAVLATVGAARGAEDVPPFPADTLAPLVEGEELLGGVATVHDDGQNAFGYPAAVLSPVERRAFAVGNAFFKDNWVIAPASAEGRDGLGPFFNAWSCSGCHLRDGRGRPLEEGETASAGLLVRLGLPGEHGDDPHPVYGGQLQEYAIHGISAEAAFDIVYETVEGTFGDGSRYELQRPRIVLSDPAYGALGADLRLGARVAPHLVGLGLLEAIPEASLLALADPDDADEDGISGRAHMVTSLRHGRAMIGRFGWRATQPTVEEQVAGALLNDMGLTTSLHPTESVSAAQGDVIEYASGGAPEVDDHKLQRMTFYSQTIAVPAQRDVADPAVRRGRMLFTETGCASCHAPELRTGDDFEIAAYRGQLIRPYTDLLLHDMGEELADTKHDGAALPTEWRTPPLWGIGLVDEVNGHTRFLHDGRARNLSEAILWHGGEGEASRDNYRELSARDRAALIAFLESL